MNEQPLYMTPVFKGGVGETVSTRDWGYGWSGRFAFAEYPLKLPNGFLKPERITVESKELKLFGAVAHYGKQQEKLLWCSLDPEVPDFIRSRVTDCQPGERRRSIPNNSTPKNSRIKNHDNY